MERARRSSRLNRKFCADRGRGAQVNGDVQDHDEHANQEPAKFVSPQRGVCTSSGFRDAGDGYGREQGISFSLSVEFENITAPLNPRDNAATLFTGNDKNWRPAVCPDENKTVRSIAGIPGNISTRGIITDLNGLWRGCNPRHSSHIHPSSALLRDVSGVTWRRQTDNKPHPYRREYGTEICHRPRFDRGKR